MKRGQVLQDGNYKWFSETDRIYVENGRVIWDWVADYADMGEATRTNLAKAIREAKKTYKHMSKTM